MADQEVSIKKRCRVEDLRVGMALGEAVFNEDGLKLLDRGAHLMNEKQIEMLLRAGVRNVVIDLGGSLIAAVPVTADLSEDARIIQEELDNPYVVTEKLKRELEVAKQIYYSAKRVIEDIMTNVRLGKNINNEAIHQAAEELIASVTRNPQALLSIVNLKRQDEYTFNHSINVATIALSLAKQLNLPDEVIKTIGIGGIMHDIGKARVPLHLLNKPGKLTDEEFELVKRHTLLGVDICMSEHFDDSKILDMVQHHHESYDGKGYPDRLASPNITKYASMVAIADVYDALTTVRSYKTKVEPPEAIQIINSWANQKFDRRLVHHFVKVIGIFPVGSVVELNSNRIGVIVGFSKDNLLKPIVKILVDDDGSKHIKNDIIQIGDTAEYITSSRPNFRLSGALSDIL